jgi:hypothetical protein
MAELYANYKKALSLAISPNIFDVATLNAIVLTYTGNTLQFILEMLIY